MVNYIKYRKMPKASCPSNFNHYTCMSCTQETDYAVSNGKDLVRKTTVL